MFFKTHLVEVVFTLLSYFIAVLTHLYLLVGYLLKPWRSVLLDNERSVLLDDERSVLLDDERTSHSKTARIMATVVPGDPMLAKQKHHHRKAFECISKALQLDEDNEVDKSGAMAMYRRGIAELQLGVAVDVDGRGEQYDRARRLRDKMAANLAMATDRLTVLAGTKKTATTPNSTRPANQRPTFAGSSKVGPKVDSGLRRPGQTGPRAGPQQRQRAAVKEASRQQQRPGRGASPAAVSAALKGVDPRLAQVITDEILEQTTEVSWDDIAGQEVAKRALHELVILPTLRPELFTGLRAPAKGLLLFGPPGNGKTMLARAVASESCATFFNISCSTLTSKYVGEGEKLVKALFALAKELQPSFVFIDEIDSLLCERREGEHEASRRLKTQFLLEFDGVRTRNDDRVLVMGATNRPQELDAAALRRFSKRIYVSLPDCTTRRILLHKLLTKVDSSGGASGPGKSPGSGELPGCDITSEQLDKLAQLTDGYSGFDLTALAKDAALAPIRELGVEEVLSCQVSEVRKLTVADFLQSLKKVRKSVSPASLAAFQAWNAEYGDVST
ncbi:spastin [Hyalella azteca]|uniref:microtubule-severing ATPase n=1 Tax=Hyalella azteca TaxID=294128 RepID=A0A8B7PH36_HYAAZ|nr:spastin [Hyalella azteca]